MFVYFLETGLLLLVVPWSVFWERNLFVDWWPIVHALFLNNFVRGAVSGIGLLCLASALAELSTLWRNRRRAPDTVAPSPAPADADLHH